jgi:thiol-disulfide isomerase/thioredoxin
MRAMHRVATLVFLAAAANGFAADREPVTETDFRGTLGVAENVRLSYRGPDCKPLGFEAFSEAMHEPGVNADVDRAADGTAITLTAKRRGSDACPAPYPPVRTLPQFDLRDLAGNRVGTSGLRGKPTLINFYFAECVPCILEVGPLNEFAASRPDMNFLAVTFDTPAEARAFVARYKFRWRIVPDARELIDRIRIKKYPTMALFDAGGRMLGTRGGGVRDELEAANVGPQLARWVDGLLRTSRTAPASGR